MASPFRTHVTPDQLVDAADGVHEPSVTRHLAACEDCRTRLSELQAAMASVAAADDGVPEPSPLFWDHFQERVVRAAQAERQNEKIAARVVRFLRPAIVVPVAAAVIVAAAVVVTNRWRGFDPNSTAPRIASVPSQGGSAAAGNASDVLRDSMDDDPSLQLIADLTVDMDWSAADAAALAPSGSAEHAVTHLDAQDLKELKRLLRAELGT